MYRDEIISHYEQNWNNKASIIKWDKGPVDQLKPDFSVLEFPPNQNRNMWTYATVCMSPLEDDPMIELHLFSDKQNSNLVELLTVVANYHQNTARFGLNHTMNFGRPWQVNSPCSFGFVSLPYIDGPDIEIFRKDGFASNCYWLIPISESEVDYKERNGVEALEQLFESKGLDYLNPNRKELV